MSNTDETPGRVPHERIEPWALVISLLPLIGFVGGTIAIFRGKRRNGRLMILVALSSSLIFVAINSH